MKKKSLILLAVTCQHDYLNQFCIPNYKYVSLKNEIEYNHKTVSYINENLFDKDYKIIICLNHYSIFLTHHIGHLLLELVPDHINIILPNIINMPIELIPMIIKNCDWSKRFFELYTQSNTLNLKKFIDTYSFESSKHIKYSNYIDNSSKLFNNSKENIIKQFIQHSVSYAAKEMSYTNMKLGIL